MPTTSCFGGLWSCWILGGLWRSCGQQTLATNSLVVVVIHTFCVQKHLCPHIFVSTHFVSGHTLAKCISFWNIVPTHIRHPSLDIFEWGSTWPKEVFTRWCRIFRLTLTQHLPEKCFHAAETSLRKQTLFVRACPLLPHVSCGPEQLSKAARDYLIRGEMVDTSNKVFIVLALPCLDRPTCLTQRGRPQELRYFSLYSLILFAHITRHGTFHSAHNTLQQKSCSTFYSPRKSFLPKYFSSSHTWQRLQKEVLKHLSGFFFEFFSKWTCSRWPICPALSPF